MGVAIARVGAVHDRFPQEVAACNRVGRLALHGSDQCRCVGGVMYFPVATGVLPHLRLYLPAGMLAGRITGNWPALARPASLAS